MIILELDLSNDIQKVKMKTKTRLFFNAWIWPLGHGLILLQGTRHTYQYMTKNTLDPRLFFIILTFSLFLPKHFSAGLEWW